MNRLRGTAFTLVPFLAAVGYVASPQAGQDTKKTQPAKEEPRYVDIFADNVSHRDATGEGEGRNVEVVDGETHIHGDVGKWNQKTKIAEASGHLNMTDPQADGTCEQAVIYFAKSKRLVIMTGGVTITVKPKKDKEAPTQPPPGPAPVVLKDGKAEVKTEKDDEEDSARKHPAVITCDRGEYLYAKDKKLGKLTGHFKVIQQLKDKTRTVTADHADWFGLDEKLILHPPVHFEDTKGNSGDSKGIVEVYTKEGEERLVSKERGIFHVKVDEDEGDTGKPAAKPESTSGKPPVGGKKD